MAGNSDEDADWVEFELDGKQVKGWLWMMPMRNGDTVEVVAEPTGNNHYVAYAVKRDGDDLLAVYPHATAGRRAHYRRSVKFWIGFSSFVYLLLLLMALLQQGWGIFLNQNEQIVLLSGALLWIAVSGLIAFRSSRKLIGSVRIAEKIFKTFGWSDIENIDLRKTAREHRRENKLPNFGNLYFRYK
jgi:hypothetical protein